MADSERIGSENEHQSQTCTAEHLGYPFRQGEFGQQNAAKILPMQPQVNADQNERRRCRKIMPGLHKLGFLHGRGKGFGHKKSGDDSGCHGEKQECVDQSAYSGTRRQAPLKNPGRYGFDPFPVQSVVKQKQGKQDQSADLVETHADDSFLIHQDQRGEHTDIQKNFPQCFFRNSHYLTPIFVILNHSIHETA